MMTLKHHHYIDLTIHAVLEFCPDVIVIICVSCWQNDTGVYQGRGEAMQWLYACEETFVREMQCGIQRFSRPLRHCVISSQQHSDIFQNVEKVCVLVMLLSLFYSVVVAALIPLLLLNAW